MKSQWKCVRQNLGEWQGSFTQISPLGEVLADIPSRISLTSSADESVIHLVLTRYYPAAPGSTDSSALVPQEMSIDLSTPGAGALFFETGAFSEGGIYFTNNRKFGAEFCLVTPLKDRRLRMVQMFDESGKFDRLTLIREQRDGSNAPERPPLLLHDLMGTWQGTATILKPQQSEPEMVIRETIQADQLEFERDGLSYRTLLLPDGAFATYPLQIKSSRAFSLEVGWLLSPNLRQRLIRQYDTSGSWIALMLLIETRNP